MTKKIKKNKNHATSQGVNSSGLLGCISIIVKDALFTDGAHHKQWYLAKILKMIEPKTYKYLKETGAGLDTGIAP